MCEKCDRIQELGEDVVARFEKGEADVRATWDKANEAADAAFEEATVQARADLKLAQEMYQRDTRPAYEARENAYDAAERQADAMRVELWRELNAAAAARGKPPVFEEDDLQLRPTAREQVEALQAKLSTGAGKVTGMPEELLKLFG